MKAPSPEIHLLRRCLVRARAELARAFAWATLRQCAFLALPWLLGRAVEEGVREGAVRAAAGWAAAFVAVAVAEYAGVRGWRWWANLADVRTGTWLRVRLLRAILALDTETARGDDRGFGDLNTRATRDVDAVRFWVHGLTTWVVIGITVVVLVPGFAALDPLLLVVALLTVPAVLAVNRVFPPLFDRRAQELAGAHGRRVGVVEELLSALLPLRGVGAEPLLVRRHGARSADVTRGTLRLGVVSASWQAAAFAVPQFAIAAGLLAAAPAVLDGRIGVGALTTFVLWMGTVSVATNAAVARLGDRAEARVAARRIAELLALAPEGSGGVPLPERGDLVVRGLAVGRPGRAPAGPLTTTVRPGEWVALTGPTGAGKSTLLRAVARLTAAGGTVTFGGVALDDAAPDDLYRTVGFVPDGPLLLHGTIRENLLLSGDHSAAELDAAAARSGLDVVLPVLEKGWDTEVGERGGALSGGQRALVALTRALIRGGPVLLLDDVTSALDAATEAEVLDRLRAATRDRAVLWAAHSPAVLARADRRIDLAAGADSVEVPRG